MDQPLATAALRRACVQTKYGFALAAVVLAIAAAPAAADRTPSPVNPSFALGPDGSPTSSTIPNGIVATKLCPGDFDGDGNQDVAAAIAGSGPAAGGLWVADGDGTGHLGTWSRVVPAVSGALVMCATADFNGDGRMDLAAVSRQDPGVTISLGRADGGFSTTTLSDDGQSITHPSGDVASGDFNGDGKPDLAIGVDDGALGTDTPSHVATLLGDGAGGFSVPAGSPYLVADPPERILTTDLNNDGLSDVVALVDGGASASSTVTLPANGDRSGAMLAASDQGWFPNSTLVDTGDLNGDGNADLLVPLNSAQVQPAFGQGNGAVNPPPACASSCAPSDNSFFGFTALALGDFNNDGILDAAVGVLKDSVTAVWTMAGTGALAEGSRMFDATAEGPNQLIAAPSSAAVRALAPVDLNGDGRLDIVAAAQAGIGVLLNTVPVPSAVTGPPSAVGGTAATVTGTVGPSGLSTTYGADLISGTGTVTRLPAAGTLSGSGTSAVSIPISGLSPNTTYRYRVYATNQDGTTVGKVLPFTTGETPSGGSGGTTVVVNPPRDTTPPAITLARLPASIKRAKLLKRGLRFTEVANEAASFENDLLGLTRTAKLARAAAAFNLTLATSTKSLGAVRRTVKLKPNRRLIGRSRKFRLQVKVIGTDSSGNRSIVVKTIKVKP